MARVFITGSSDGLGLMAARLLIEEGQHASAAADNCPSILVSLDAGPPDNHLGPGGGQPGGHAEADAAVTAGHDRDMAIQIEDSHLALAFLPAAPPGNAADSYFG
jgi:NAD(P)-dependent dehydrogenase (short-subunit alcohol dehydrogenase family)